MKHDPIRIVIGEDHAIVRAGLRQTLSMEPDLQVVGEAADGPGLLQAAAAHDPDVVLADISMPGLSGLDLVKALRRDHATRPVLVLSMHRDVQIVARVLRAGANGYVSKDAEPAALVEALRRTARGQRYVEPALAQRMVLDGAADERTPATALSDREFQVLRALVRGETPARIALDLGLSTKTVSAHKVRVMRKLGVATTAELVRRALEQRLVE